MNDIDEFKENWKKKRTFKSMAFRTVTKRPSQGRKLYNNASVYSKIFYLNCFGIRHFSETLSNLHRLYCTCLVLRIIKSWCIITKGFGPIYFIFEWTFEYLNTEIYCLLVMHQKCSPMNVFVLGHCWNAVSSNSSKSTK